ncbi:hypothetical protein A2U01_0081284, partial [Trifolium medium]|nr:hypothetical protein [Trifolium medium]
MSRDDKNHELNNLDQDQAANATYQDTESAKRNREVMSDTPPTSPPPKPTTVSASPTL